MPTYVYQLGNGGNWICGFTKDSEPVSSFSRKVVKALVDGTWRVEIRSLDGAVLFGLDTLDSYAKENGQPYRSIEEFERLTAELFSEISIDPVVGPVGIIDVTYEELKTLMMTSGLVVNQSYKITDFRTIHYLVFGDLVLDPVPNEGNIEPLIVTAISTNNLNREATSLDYPEDKIYYDPTNANWARDPAFAGEGGIIPGFRGVIYFRHDTINDNSMGYDFRNVKFRRFKSAMPVWSAETTYTQGARVQTSLGIYSSLIADNLNNLVSDSIAWTMLVDFTVTDYVTANPNDTWLIGTGPTDSADFLTFAELTGSAAYSDIVRSNHFELLKDDVNNYESSGSILLNNVFFLPQATDPVSFQICANKFSPKCVDNTFLGNVSGNTFGTGFFRNCCSQGFMYNIIEPTAGGNLFGPFFSNNYIGSMCTNVFTGDTFRDNKMGAFIFSITFGNTCVNNDFGSHLQNGIFPQNLEMNKFHNGFKCEWLDFQLATHLVNPYNCELMTDLGGNLRLRYIDALGIQQIVAANA